MRLMYVIMFAFLVSCFSACTQQTPPAGPGEATKTDKPAVTASAEPASDLPKVELTEDELKAAETLAETVSNKNLFPSKDQGKKENARLFLYLASTSKDEPVVAASLQGMSRAWTMSDTDKTREKVNDDYRKVVLHYLDSKSALLQGRAIEASKLALEGSDSDKKMVEKLIEIAVSHPEGGARVEALDSLAKIKDFEKKENLADVFLKSLGDSTPYVRSTALFKVQHKQFGLVKKDDFFKKIRELMKDENPGVRGRAAESVVGLTPDADKDAVAVELLEMLKDKEAYVRSAAMNGLARLRRKEAIPRIVSLLEDTTRNTFDIPYTKLTAESGSVHHDGSAWSRVNDSALRAISDISSSMKESKFTYGKIDYKNVEGDLAREAKLAKEWYEKNKSNL